MCELRSRGGSQPADASASVCSAKAHYQDPARPLSVCPSQSPSLLGCCLSPSPSIIPRGAPALHQGMVVCLSAFPSCIYQPFGPPLSAPCITRFLPFLLLAPRARLLPLQQVTSASGELWALKHLPQVPRPDVTSAATRLCRGGCGNTALPAWSGLVSAIGKALETHKAFSHSSSRFFWTLIEGLKSRKNLWFPQDHMESQCKGRIQNSSFWTPTGPLFPALSSGRFFAIHLLSPSFGLCRSK